MRTARWIGSEPSPEVRLEARLEVMIENDATPTPTHDLDRFLVRRLLTGDDAAFEEFWREHATRLHRFVRSRLHGDADLTAEIVQAALCKALESLESYRGTGSLFSWLCGVCRYEILGHLRQRRRAPQLEPLEAGDGDADGLLATLEHPEPGPELDVLRTEARLRVHDTLDRLPNRYSQALEWKYDDRLSVREIARRLELSEKAAESLLTRARKAFRDAFLAPTGE